MAAFLLTFQPHPKQECRNCQLLKGFSQEPELDLVPPTRSVTALPQFLPSTPFSVFSTALSQAALGQLLPAGPF